MIGERAYSRNSIWLGLAWFLIAGCLGMTAWTLLQLDASGVYILPLPGINGITLGVSLSLLAIAPSIAGIYTLVRRAVGSTRRRLVARLVKMAGWITGIIVALFFSCLSLAMIVLIPGGSYMLHSPNDGRTALIVNRTFLHAGGFTVYQSRNWPLYVEVGSVITNNAHDPFREGTYRAAWTDEGLQLDYVFDYMKPNTYHQEVIELRR